MIIKPWIRIRDPDPQLEKMLDPDPDPADPKPWYTTVNAVYTSEKSIIIEDSGCGLGNGDPTQAR